MNEQMQEQKIVPGDFVQFELTAEGAHDLLKDAVRVIGQVLAEDEGKLVIQELKAAHRIWGYSFGGAGDTHYIDPDKVELYATATEKVHTAYYKEYGV